jgi:hypothetical protein
MLHEFQHLTNSELPAKVSFLMEWKWQDAGRRAQRVPCMVKGGIAFLCCFVARFGYLHISIPS